MVKARGIFKGDLVIWAVYFFLIAISLVEEFSAASTLAYKSGDYWGVLYNHAIFLFVGFVILWGIHNIPCRWFRIVPLFGLPLILIALIATLAFGKESNEGVRWLSIFGMQLQPSEFAKPIMVTSIALLLSYNQREEGADPRLFNKILWITFVFCGLIVTQNFSTAALIFVVVFAMMIIGRVPRQQMLKLTLSLIGIGLVSALVLLSLPKDSFVFDLPGLGRALTWKNRIADFMGNGEASKAEVSFKQAQDSIPPGAAHRDSLLAAKYPIADNAQTGHANIAISSAHLIGKGPGNSVQRDFLSQAFSDFIFAIIIEELGILGGVFVVLLYIILLFRAARIASRCERNFPAFLILGLSILIVFQALVNMFVAVGLIPVTGQTLPLISRGGSSIISVSISLGMMLSVSRYARKRKPAASDAQPSANIDPRDDDAAIRANFEDAGKMI
ncbi:MAG: FtsW/RodA/SpoVE family cell cycle protein [Bacteroidaceae bacterium]|nr:FtsW/RodA/SpoVE family cell cycle protein [Bacteroidaceae bacterium]